MNLDISNFKKHSHNESFSKELENNLISMYSIDRFEGKYAICENIKTGEMVNIEKELLPQNVKEGSIIKFENGKYIIDVNETKEKQKNIKNMVDNLFNKK